MAAYQTMTGCRVTSQIVSTSAIFHFRGSQHVCHEHATPVVLLMSAQQITLQGLDCLSQQQAKFSSRLPEVICVDAAQVLPV